jgi:hypothetical protein
LNTNRENIVTATRIQELQARAVPPQSIQIRGRYTNPPTWGVYRCGSTFHKGNHPVRQDELAREFGAVELHLLFRTDAEANELKQLLNKGGVGTL